MNESKVAYRYKLFAIFVVKLSIAQLFHCVAFYFQAPVSPKKFEGSTSLLLPPGVENPS